MRRRYDCAGADRHAAVEFDSGKPVSCHAYALPISVLHVFYCRMYHAEIEPRLLQAAKPALDPADPVKAAARAGVYQARFWPGLKLFALCGGAPDCACPCGR